MSDWLLLWRWVVRVLVVVRRICKCWTSIMLMGVMLSEVHRLSTVNFVQFLPVITVLL